MKQMYRIIETIGLIALMLSLLNAPALAQEAANNNRFPEGVIEVPQGTAISIDDDAGTVTITNSPIEIKVGDTFVVFLQDLPIGYVANAVTVDGNDTIITAEKADNSVYALLNTEGVIDITPEMYEFIPAENVSFAVARSSVDTRSLDFGYENGKLRLKAGLGGSYSEVYISNLRLSYSAADGNISLGLAGDWGIDGEIKAENDLFDDIGLGEIRIFGIGKIKLSLSFKQSMSLRAKISGTFFIGVGAAQDGSGTASKGIDVTDKFVEGKGSLTASLKVTAGVDVLFAAADLYINIGAETEFATKYSYDPETNERTDCQDYKICVFAKVGVEVQYYNILAGKMSTLTDVPLWDLDDTELPHVIGIHFENGQLVSQCTKGMSPCPTGNYGGLDASFSSTLLTDGRARILESDISLPFDMTVDQDLTLAHGNLNLNGHTLEIEGDLIQSGGTLIFDGGTLIVHGDYRMQSYNDGEYGDSTGTLFMNGGTINLYGDLILQTNSENHSVCGGSFVIKGNITQLNPTNGVSHFESGTGCNFVLSSDNYHTLQFSDVNNNGIGWVSLMNNVTSQGGIKLGRVDVNGHQLVVNGDMVSAGDINIDEGVLSITGSLYKDSTGDIDVDGGVLTIAGNLYHQAGDLIIDRGKATIGGNYYIVGEGSCFTAGKENYLESSGYLVMNDTRDEVRVGGDFIGNSGLNNLTAGVLYVGGDFRQLSGFEAGEGHKTVFTNTGNIEIEVAAEYGVGGFGQLQIEAQQVTFKGNIAWCELLSDLDNVISDNMRMGSVYYNKGTMNLSGHTICINGDVEIYHLYAEISLDEGSLSVDGNVRILGSLDLDGGRFSVTGNVYHQAGDLIIDRGKATIGGNYYIVGEGSCFTAGKENYLESSGYLVMNDTRDEVRVGGDFIGNSGLNNLTAGVLYVGGDFRQLDGFEAGEGHKTVLNGIGLQYISFANLYDHFGILEITQPIDMYVFNPNPCWITLIVAEKPVFGEANFTLPTALIGIDESAFEGISATIVSVPDTCTSIGAYAFRDAAVTQIRIPAGCSIADTAFDGCEAVLIFGTVGSEAEIFCENHDNCTFVAE